MKYLKTYEVWNPNYISEYERKKKSNNIFSFERTFSVSETKKIFNIIEALKIKGIEYKLFSTKKDIRGTNTTLIKIYGKTDKTRTLKKLGFNLLPDDYEFTWDWKPIETDLETFINSTKYNI